MSINAMFGVSINTDSSIMGQTGLSAVMGQALASAISNMTADFWQKFEFDASAGAMTTSQLATDSGKSAGDYTITDAGSILSTFTSDQVTLLSTVNGVADTGTRGLNMLLTTGLAGRVTYAFAQANTLTVGMFYHTSTPASFDTGPQFLFLKSTAFGEDNFYIQDQRNAGDNTRQFAIRSNGVTSVINGIADNTTYWVCANYIRNSAASSVTVRSVTGTLVATVAFTAPDVPNDILWFGNLSVITAQVGINAYIDNVVMKFSGASSSDYGP